MHVKTERTCGLIGIASSTMGRYREFDITLHKLAIHPQSDIQSQWEIGLDLAHSFNRMCDRVLKEKKIEWLWILGDDHVLTPYILANLLSRKVDIVVPLCLKRSNPFRPVAYTLNKDNGKYYQISAGHLRGKTGLVTVDASGNAGMLIKRNVIETLGGDWHRLGWQPDDLDRGGSDLYFCKRVTEAGFKIHLDLDTHIGHITHMAIWPNRKPDGEYSVGIRDAMDIPE